MRPLFEDLRQALRSLRRAPGFTAVAVLTLALGVGATTAIFSAASAVLLRPLPFAEPDRLVLLHGTTPDRGERGASPADFLDWREASRTLEHLSAYDVRTGNLQGDGEPERLTFATVSADFFATLGVDAAAGRALREDDPSEAGARTAVLSHGFWTRRFGADPAVLGGTVTLDGEPFTVVGVMPAEIDFPAGAELWVRAPHDVPDIPFLPPEMDVRRLRDAWFLRVVGRLAPGASLAEAQAEMELISSRLRAAHPASNEGAGVRLAPLHGELAAGARPVLLALLGAVGLVLLIACANLANLALVRASGRMRELAVRSALGAGRMRLVRALLAESAVLAAAGGAAGLVVAAAGVRLIAAAAPAGAIPLGEATLDGGVLLFCAAVSAATALLFGLAPALAASRVEPRAWLGQRTAGGGVGGRRSRGALVAAEVALATVLVAGTSLLVRSLWNLTRVDPGIRTERLLSVRLSLPAAHGMEPEAVRAAYAGALAAVEGAPGVASAALALAGPLDRGPGAGLRIEGRAQDPGSLPDTRWQTVTPDYFRTAGIPLRAGRALQARDREGAEPVAVVNEALARQHWPGESAVGRRINTGLDGDRELWVTVVGVVGDTRNRGLAAAPAPELFRPLTQPVRFGGSEMMLLVRSGSPPEVLLPALRAAVWRERPGMPLYAVRTGAEMVYRFTEGPRFVLLLLGLFAALALLLGAVGVYGVTAFLVGQRRREIGVRLALGAPSGRVARMVVGEGLGWTAAGLVVGIPLSLAATRALRGMLFEVSPLDPLALGTGCATLLAVAGIASLLPARRAARVDPQEALRAD